MSNLPGYSYAGAAWPDEVDSAALLLAAAVMVGVPVVGWALLVVDVRRYLRALKARALIVVGYLSKGNTPHWVVRDRPPCLHSLGLSMPCTEEDVLAAYRTKVKDLHPDRGGEMQEFLKLQKHFEQALHLVRQHAERANPD